ncbi:hypothetical protein EBU99_06265 [bacterium]|nr:hypothetical protein [bacterium]
MKASTYSSNGSRVLSLLLGALVFSCVSRVEEVKKPVAAEVGKSRVERASDVKLTPPVQNVVCPDGTRFNANPRVCVTRAGFALGPFPLELQEICRQKSPSDATICVQRQDWPFELLMSLISSYQMGCPPGTIPGQSGVCVAPDAIYGPFTLQQVMACRAALPAGKQQQCDDVVWPQEFLKFTNEGSAFPVVGESESNKSDQRSNDKSDVRKPSSADTDDSPSWKRNVQSPNMGTIAPPPPPPVQTSQDNARESSSSVEVSTITPTNPTPTPIPKPTEIPRAIQTPQPVVEELPKAPTYCVYSWEERPGTADFTAQNRRLNSLLKSVNYPLDRPQESTLLANKDFQSLDTCGRARFLKACFQKIVFESSAPAAQTFRTWAQGRVRPLEAHMAIVMKESRLGLWHDECWKGQCKGVGIARVKVARSTSGKRIAREDVVWRGITHNILTNLQFSLRMLAVKAAAGPSDLYQLAYLYNGLPGKQERYALDVDKYYKELLDCRIEDRN